MAQRSSRFDLSTRLLSWWYNQKNKIIKNIHVQDFLARFPITSRIARKEGEEIFQLMTGFVDTQILFTFVKSGALKHLETGSLSIEELSGKIEVDFDRTEILCRAWSALGLVRLKSKRIFLARRGALILSLPGMMELIDHHSILYEDLLDPISFFRGENETKLGSKTIGLGRNVCVALSQTPSIALNQYQGRLRFRFPFCHDGLDCDQTHNRPCSGQVQSG